MFQRETTVLQFLFLHVSTACHSSCSSCWGPSVSQCTQCPGGLLLHQGQCVEACGEGLYSQDNTCHSKSFGCKPFTNCSTLSATVAVIVSRSPLSCRLSPLVPLLCGTPGLRLPPLPQTRGSAHAAVQPPRSLHGRLPGTQLPGLSADLPRWVCEAGGGWFILKATLGLKTN